MPVANPCLKCGACCTFFRVSFYWSETDVSVGGTVPPEMTEPVPPFYACMRGTNHPKPRCVALRGRLGDQVACSIYERRSSTCREFGFQLVNGELTISPEDLERCNHARSLCGLPPLKLDNVIRRVNAALLHPGFAAHHHPPFR